MLNQRRFVKLALLASLCFSLHIIGGEEPTKTEKKESTKPAITASSEVYLNPVTGEPMSPTPGMIKYNVKNARSTSSEGLVITQSKSKAGGMEMHLQGRFQGGITATIDADGKAVARCAHGVPMNDENHSHDADTKEK